MGEPARMVLPIQVLRIKSVDDYLPLEVKLRTHEEACVLFAPWMRTREVSKPHRVMFSEVSGVTALNSRCIGCRMFVEELVAGQPCTAYGEAHHMVHVDANGAPTIPIIQVPLDTTLSTAKGTRR